MSFPAPIERMLLFSSFILLRLYLCGGWTILAVHSQRHWVVTCHPPPYWLSALTGTLSRALLLFRDIVSSLLVPGLAFVWVAPASQVFRSFVWQSVIGGVWGGLELLVKCLVELTVAQSGPGLAAGEFLVVFAHWPRLESSLLHDLLLVGSSKFGKFICFL